jgi:predicted nucleic acid-binding Zn ribbon protein
MSLTCNKCSSMTTTTCAWCYVPVCDVHSYLGQPFIRARDLVTITATTAVRAPALLKDILVKELPQVPYCTECRTEIMARRQREQLKFMLGILMVVAIIMALVLSIPYIG